MSLLSGEPGGVTSIRTSHSQNGCGTAKSSPVGRKKRNNLVGAETSACGFACPLSHRAQGGFVSEEFGGVSGHGVHVAHVGEETTYAVFHNFGHSPSASRNGDNLAGHCLQRCQSK